MTFPIYFELEGFKFELPSSTLLTGPMAAAKPLFAQKFIAAVLNEREDIRVFYFATSAPVESILRNLEVFGLKRGREKITFFDYDPAIKELKKEGDSYYKGDYSIPEMLRRIFGLAGENTIVVIPSFTLLLVNSDNKEGLLEVLTSSTKNKNLTSFVAVSSDMFQEFNEKLIDVSDNIMNFFKKGEKIFIKVTKFKGEYDAEEKEFKFAKELFTTTKKEVAERTAKIIRAKKS
ncbi:RAD55 family ATPase [Caldanaerobacter subterraneus]|uniref:KaiC-like domain-containing protein n=1 Tax=Caldanaerobacter subterraneus TaxID=911092 RepID=A0A7Y2L8D2_9THEO|nr:hypothetical protein [Caldanaerobacter subterraneus]NNG67057.1 hypothetical protein [Caldanaerobacter subterraneus]